MMSEAECVIIIADQAHIIEKQAEQIKKLSEELALHINFENENEKNGGKE